MSREEKKKKILGLINEFHGSVYKYGFIPGLFFEFYSNEKPQGYLFG